MNRQSQFTAQFTAFLLALSLAACGGGGDDPDPGPDPGPGPGPDPTGTDFTVTAVSVTDQQGNALPAPELQIGHPSKVSLTITSNTAVDNVGVMLWIQDTLNNDDAGRLAVGATGFDLAAGTHSYTTDMLVPYTMPNVAPCVGATCDGEPEIDYNPIPAGEYYLFAQADPANMIVETNEDNNVPASASFPTGAVVVDVRDDYANTPTVMLEEVVVDISDAAGMVLDVFDPLIDPQEDWCGRIPEFDLDIADIPNTTIGITAVINASGSFQALTEGVATAIPYVQVDATFDLPNKSIPLEFWDSAEGQYSDHMLVPDVEPGVSHAVYVDLLLDFDELEPVLSQGLQCQTQIAAGCSGPLLDLDCSNITNACGQMADMLQEVQTMFGTCMDGPTIDEFFGYGPYTLPKSFDGFMTCLDESNQGIKVRLTPLDSNFNVITDRFEPVGIDMSNETVVDVIMNPVPPPPRPEPRSDGFTFASGFAEGFKTKYLSAGVWGTVEAGVDRSRGAFTGVEAGVPVTLFGNSFELAGMVATGKAQPWGGACLFETDLSLLGAVVLPGTTEGLPCDPDSDEGFSSYWQVGGPTCPTAAGSNCFQWDPDDDDERARYNECMRDCWAIGTGKGGNKQFMVGPVPINVDFSVSGASGLTIKAEVPCGDHSQLDNSAFEGSGGLWASIGADVKAGVGFSIASAGVGGSATLIKDELIGRAVADLEKVSDTDIKFTVGSDLVNTLTGPEGKIYAYAKVTIDYWLGDYTLKYTKNILKLGPAYEPREDVIFCATDDTTVEMF